MSSSRLGMRGLRAAASLAGFAIVSAVAQAGFFTTHHINNLEASGAPMVSGLFFVRTTAGSFITIVGGGGYTANIGNNTFADPFERAGMTVRATFMGVKGSAVIVGMSSAAGINAIGEAFSDVFTGFSEAAVAAAISEVANLNLTNVSLLASMFSTHDDKWAAEGDVGYAMAFTNASPVGNYQWGQEFRTTSVPEPMTMALMGAAASLGAWRQRRRRKIVA